MRSEWLEKRLGLVRREPLALAQSFEPRNQENQLEQREGVDYNWAELPKRAVSFCTVVLASKIKLVNAPRGIELDQGTQIEKVAVTPENPKGEQEVEV